VAGLVFCVKCRWPVGLCEERVDFPSLPPQKEEAPERAPNNPRKKQKQGNGGKFNSVNSSPNHPKVELILFRPSGGEGGLSVGFLMVPKKSKNSKILQKAPKKTQKVEKKCQKLKLCLRSRGPLGGQGGPKWAPNVFPHTGIVSGDALDLPEWAPSRLFPAAWGPLGPPPGDEFDFWIPRDGSWRAGNVVFGFPIPQIMENAFWNSSGVAFKRIL